MVVCSIAIPAISQSIPYAEYRTPGKMILEVQKDKVSTRDHALITIRLLNNGAVWSGFCQVTELNVVASGQLVEIESNNFRVMDDPNLDRSFFRELQSISVHDSVLYFDLHRDMDHVMKVRAHFKAYGDQKFRINSIYGAELDFGLAGRRDSSALIEWRSVDSLFVALPYSRVR
jgi:hypothetical protein